MSAPSASGELFDRAHLVGAADPAPSGHDDVGLGQVQLLARDLLDAQDLPIRSRTGEVTGQRPNLGLPRRRAVRGVGARLHGDEHGALTACADLRFHFAAEDRPLEDQSGDAFTLLRKACHLGKEPGSRSLSQTRDVLDRLVSVREDHQIRGFARMAGATAAM